MDVPTEYYHKQECFLCSRILPPELLLIDTLYCGFCHTTYISQFWFHIFKKHAFDLI